MAFGTFFKKILTGAKNLVNKAAPIIRKGLDAVSKVTPFIQAGATALGGPIGAAVGNIASTVGGIASQAGQFIDKTELSNGFSGSRFDVPLLK